MTLDTTPKVYDIIRDLRKTRREKQRERFFEELAKLRDLPTELEQLLLFGRKEFAPGPYPPDEFALMHPEIQEKLRKYTVEEQVQLEAHAVAVEGRKKAREALDKAIVALDLAERQPGLGVVVSGYGDRARSPAQEAELTRLRDELDKASDLFDAADELEVRSRPHQPERVQRRGLKFPPLGIIRRF